MKWIDVNDRLPEEDEPVLCAIEHTDGEISTELRWISSYEVMHREKNGFSLITSYEKEVLAWMPLPEYKKDESKRSN